MAERAYIISVIERLLHRPSEDMVRKFSDDNAGIGCMLQYLFHENRPVSAGEISKFMRVSTARVSVLIRKMSEKGFIIRENSSEDARRLMISISERGAMEFRRRQEKMIDYFGEIIDKIGADRIEEFISVLQEMKKITSDMQKNIRD